MTTTNNQLTHKQFVEIATPFIQKVTNLFVTDKTVEENESILRVEQNQLIFEVPFFIRQIFFQFNPHDSLKKVKKDFNERSSDLLRYRIQRLREELRYFREDVFLYINLHEKIEPFIEEINTLLMSKGYVERPLLYLVPETKYKIVTLFMSCEKLYAFHLDEKYREDNFKRFDSEKENLRNTVIQTAEKIPALKQEARKLFEKVKEEILALPIAKNSKKFSWIVEDVFSEYDGGEYFECFYKGKRLDSAVCRYTNKNPLFQLTDGSFKNRIVYDLKEQVEYEEEQKKEVRLKAFAESVCPEIDVLISYPSEYTNKKTFEFQLCEGKYGWTFLSPNFNLNNNAMKQRFIDAVEQRKQEIFELEDALSLRNLREAGPLLALKPPHGMAEPVLRLGKAYYFMPENKFVYEGHIVQTFMVKGRDQVEKRQVYKSGLKVTDRKEVHDIMNELQIVVALKQKEMREAAKKREEEFKQRYS